jgi:hypothetical protein
MKRFGTYPKLSARVPVLKISSANQNSRIQTNSQSKTPLNFVTSWYTRDDQSEPPNPKFQAEQPIKTAVEVRYIDR